MIVLALLAWPACRCKPPPRGARAPAVAPETHEPLRPAPPLAVRPEAPDAAAAGDAAGEPPQLRRDLDVRAVLHLAGSGSEAVTALAAAPDATSVFAGVVFDGELSVGGQRFESAGDRDGLVVRLERDGALRWAVPLGGPGEDHIDEAASGGAGEVVVVAGHFAGELAVGGRVLQARGEDGFVIALDGEDGAVRWALPVGGAGDDGVSAVAVLDSGAVCFGGYGEDALEVGALRLEGSGVGGFVACVDADGAPLGALRVAAEGSARVTALAAVPGGSDVIAAGLFSGALAVPGAEPVAAQGRGDAFALRGTLEAASLRSGWLRTLGGEGRERLAAALVREDGAAVLGGSFTGVFELAPYRVASGDQRNPFVAVVDEDGGDRWLQALSGDQPGEVAALLAAPERGLVAVGTFQGELSLGPARLASEGGSVDVFVLRLHEEGYPVAMAWLGGPDHESLGDAVWLDDTVLALGGSFAGTTTLGFESLTAQGGGDDGWIAFVRAPQAW